MEILFADKKLEKTVHDDRKMLKEFGKLRTVRLRLRIAQLQDAVTLEDVRCLSGNYHELTGDRKGQWACDLDQPYRLVFEPLEYPIPTNEYGQFVWLKILGVEIIEIVNYHKEK